jgi:hypothetical protein
VGILDADIAALDVKIEAENGPFAARPAWIEQWNEHPRPFVWTKTAGETPNSLAVSIQAQDH